jgi:hypothetical protein
LRARSPVIEDTGFGATPEPFEDVLHKVDLRQTWPLLLIWSLPEALLLSNQLLSSPLPLKIHFAKSTASKMWPTGHLHLNASTVKMKIPGLYTKLTEAEILISGAPKISHKKRPGMLVHYNPSYSGGGGRRISSSRPAQAKLVRPYIKNKIQTKGLGHGSSGRASPTMEPGVGGSRWFCSTFTCVSPALGGSDRLSPPISLYTVLE